MADTVVHELPVTAVGGGARFLFVDRILAHERERWIRAEHRLPETSDRRGDPYRMLEALAQAAGWLIAASTGFAKRGLPVSIGSVHLSDLAAAGRTVLLEAEIVAWRGESAVVKGRASIDGRPVAEIERALCALVPSEHLDDPERTRATFSVLLAGSGAESVETPGDGWPAPAALDRIPGPGETRCARASWSVSPTERFFPDHFPRLPIVPGAVQVQAMVELAQHLVSAAGSPPPVLLGIREAKFRGFVRPGDCFLVETEAVSLTAERGVATAKGLVDGKRVVSVQEIHWRRAPSFSDAGPIDRL